MQIDRDNLRVYQKRIMGGVIGFFILLCVGLVAWALHIAFRAIEDDIKCDDEFVRFMESIAMYCEKKNIEECYRDLSHQHNFTHSLIHYLRQCKITLV